MKENSCNDDLYHNDDGGVVLPRQVVEKTASFSCSSYSIEVCQGPDCTGLGGGIAILEIEELVREYKHESNGNGCVGGNRIRVVAGGCRDFCSVGPNAHVLEKKRKPEKSSISMLESFQNVSDASSCDRVVSTTIAYASASSKSSSDNSDDPSVNNETTNTSMSLSMMTRRAERKRWEALKDVSRTIAKAKRMVATSDNGIERKLRIWKETSQDRIDRATTTARTSQRDQRRAKRLIEITSEKLERICLKFDDQSDSSSYSSSDQSETIDE